MIELLHHPLSAPSRFIRLVLGECEISPNLVEEEPWERREEFLILNPAGTLPVLIEDRGPPICGHWAISEFLDETRSFALGERALLPEKADGRAEARRLTDWFLGSFEVEVNAYLFGEKVEKLQRRDGNRSPNPAALRAARANIRTHLRYIAHLIGARHWLAGDTMSHADLAAAAALYLDEVPWDESEEAKDWYARIKSRPSFRPLLTDTVRGVTPPTHYTDLDF
ncbi:MAG: glutathione S-transferase family protein [Alphaproteobacteria bacterium]